MHFAENRGSRENRDDVDFLFWSEVLRVEFACKLSLKGLEPSRPFWRNSELACARGVLQRAMAGEALDGVESDVKTTIETTAPKAPVTYSRNATCDGTGVEKPHVPRAMEAVDADHPQGTPGYNNNGYTVLQQHIAFFDRNNDGVIYPWETFQGFHALGFNYIISTIGMLFIHSAQSYPTLESWIPDLRFPVYIRNIHKAKHGSDSEVYDTEGRFVPSKFEEIFSKFAKTEKTRMTFSELMEMTAATRNVADPFGWIATKGEWSVTYWLLKDKDCFVSKESIRGMLDGSIFEKVEKMRKSKNE